MRIAITLAAGFGVALAASGPVEAQSYKERGYGGPLYVGPNFEQGGQHTPPDYGSARRKKAPKATIERAPAKKDVAKSHKAPAPSEREVEASPPKDADADRTTTVASPASPDSDVDAGSTATGASTAESSAASSCKKFDSTTGQTFTVPCE